MNRIINVIIAVIFLVTSNFGFDTLQVKEVGPGVIYYKIIDSIRPLSIDVLKIDLKTKPKSHCPSIKKSKHIVICEKCYVVKS